MLSLETARTMMKVWCAGEMDVLPSVFSCSFSVFLWAAASANTYERKHCTAGGEENWRRKRRDKGDGEGVLVGPSVFSSVYVLSFYSSLLCSSSSVCFSGFLSRASPVSPSVFSVHPSSHSRLSCLYWEEMVDAAMAGMLTVRKGSEGWCLRGLSVKGRLVREEIVIMVWGRWCECTWVAGLSNNQGCWGRLGWLEMTGPALIFLVFKLLPPTVNIFLRFVHIAGFTYIKNLYTCYLKKYCNNYCRDCLL